MRAGTVEASGLSLAYVEQGAGVPVALVHGTAVGRELWREVGGALGDDLRVIAYDRRAYGRSEAPDPYRGTTIGEQAEDAAALIAALEAAPAILCGFDVGALIALDLLRRHGHLVSGAVLVEPALLELSRDGPATVSALREAVERGARETADSSAGAVDAYLGKMAGEEAFERLGGDRIAAAHRAGRAFAADLAAPPTFAFTRRELRALDAPVTVMSALRSAPVRREVARALADLLPNAALREPDAGHLLPVEAPDDLAVAVRELASR